MLPEKQKTQDLNWTYVRGFLVITSGLWAAAARDGSAPNDDPIAITARNDDLAAFTARNFDVTALIRNDALIAVLTAVNDAIIALVNGNLAVIVAKNPYVVRF